MEKIAKMARTMFAPAIDFALPPRCAGCGTIVGAPDQFCTPCWSGLHFLTEAGCLRCGIPMDLPGQVCAPCMAEPPRHDGVRAAVAYGEVARSVAIRLKHGRRTGLARLMAKAMVRRMPEDAEVLIPVPLHRWRIWSRGFNQSMLVAREIERLAPSPSAISISAHTLIRKKSTPMLGGLGRKERARAVRGAFSVAPEQRASVHDRHVLLIDDVYTSGATANACALALKRAGASRVTILCWARVLPDGD
jgi:ComF family protein